MFFGNCGERTPTSEDTGLVNPAHLDALFEEIKLETGENVGIIHIYCEAPDYQWVGDEDEGIACVDDAARAMVFYFKHYIQKGNPESMRKARLLLKFLLNMQAKNGYFHNFIWQDGSINKEGRTSRAEPNWWSWRTMWAFGEALTVLDQTDELARQMRTARQRLLSAILEDFPMVDSTFEKEGITLPSWLPYGTSADQAALILLGLSPVYADTKDSVIERHIRHFSKGICMMQIRDKGDFPNGAFLSWENLWHAYGNNQAYALLVTAGVLKDTNIMNCALQEIDLFYPKIIESGGLNQFWVKRDSGKTEVYDKRQFPQIAYGIRPMVWACMEAGKMTGNEKYFHQVKAISRWFFGNNPAGAILYDTKTGRGYDGILSPSELNLNAGAESTIEALLVMQAVENQAQWKSKSK